MLLRVLSAWFRYKKSPDFEDSAFGWFAVNKYLQFDLDS